MLTLPAYPVEYVQDRLFELLESESELVVFNKAEIERTFLKFASRVSDSVPINLELKFLLNNEKDITQYFERDSSFMRSTISSNSVENFYQIYCDNQNIVTLNDFLLSKYPELFFEYLEAFFMASKIKLSVLNNLLVEGNNTRSSASVQIIGVELKLIFFTD